MSPLMSKRNPLVSRSAPSWGVVSSTISVSDCVSLVRSADVMMAPEPTEVTSSRSVAPIPEMTAEPTFKVVPCGRVKVARPVVVEP